MTRAAQLRCLALSAGLALIGAPTWAGGPRRVNDEGEPLAWPTGSTIVYSPEGGNLGRLTNAEARALVAQAFDVWEALGVLSFSEGASLTSIDVDAAGVPNTNPEHWAHFVLPGPACPPTCTSPVIFDSDGSILDGLFGPGARFVFLGAGGLRTPVGADPTIREAFVIVNGALYDGLGPADDSPQDVSLEVLKAAIVHEIGHFLNLDHSALNGELAGDGDADNDRYLPTMYPTSSDDDAALATLNADDRAAFLGLYSSGPAHEIPGIVFADGSPFQGAEVVLRRVSDLLGTAYSISSGTRCGACEPEDPARGAYSVRFLEPGGYRVCVQQIDRTLTQLGPLSRQALLPGPEECYDGNESGFADDDPDNASTISSSAGFFIDIYLDALPDVDPFEPNDSLAASTVLADLPAGRDTAGAVLGAGDLDYYAIPVSAGQRVRIDLDAAELGALDPGGESFDPLIGVFAPSGALLDVIDDGIDPDSGEFSIDPVYEFVAASAGTAHVVVSSYPDLDLNGVGATTHGPYWIRVEVDSDADADGTVDRHDVCPADPADDSDGDGVCGGTDNCPAAANTSQANGDGDARGDACDNCPALATSNVADADGDGAGDACDACPADPGNDADGDGICGNADNCPGAGDPAQGRVKLNGALVLNGDASQSYRISPDGSRLVYAADQDSDEVFELYSVPIGGGTRVKLNGALVAGGDVLGAPTISPDGARVVYTADQQTDELFELYSVPITGGAAVKLNGPLVPFGDVVASAISPDGSWMVYRADQQADEVFELYSVPITGGVAVTLNGALAAGGDVFANFEITPDGSRVVYLADQDTDTVTELYVVPITGGSSLKLNGPLVVNGDVGLIQVSPDSSRVVYRADAETDDVVELYSVFISGGGLVKLNGTLVLNGDVTTFSSTPDGLRVIYTASQETAATFELYSVPIGGGTPVKLNRPLPPNGDVDSTFQFGAGGARVLYRADQDADDVFEIYSVPIGGGTPIKLNGTPVTGGDVINTIISSDGSRVVYRADQAVDGMIEIYGVPITGGMPLRLNGPLPAGGNVTLFDLVPTRMPGQYVVVYIADQNIDNVFELYVVPITGGTPLKLNGTLQSNGDVSSGALSSNGLRVVYRADQDADEVFELYSALLDWEGDGVASACDICPTNFDPAQADSDGDGVGDACDDCPALADPEQGNVRLSGPVQDVLPSGAGGRPGVVVSPDSSRTVYLTNSALYSVPLAGGTPVQLNGLLTPGGKVLSFLVSPDGARVVYVADQDVDEVFELYSVPIAGGVAIKLNGPLDLAGKSALPDYGISPDGSRVVYSIDQDVDGVFELYSVAITGGTAVKLNGPLAGDVNEFAINSGSSRVVYFADQDTPGIDELYSVPITGGAPVKLNGPLVQDGEVYEFAVSPGGSRVVYLADQDTALVDELYSVPITGGTVIKLNGTLVLNGEVYEFAVSPDGSRVVYLADQDVDDVDELYSVPITGGTAIKLNGPLVQDGYVFEFAISPDGARVVYLADQQTFLVDELWSVSITGGPTVKLNGPLAQGGDVYDFAISPDSSWVVYRGDQDTFGVFEVYGVPITGGVAVKLNAPLVVNGDVDAIDDDPFEISPDSSLVVYFADQQVDDVFELYAVPITGGSQVRLNDPLTPRDDALSFAFSPDSSRIVYVAGLWDNFDPLYAALLDREADGVANVCDVCPSTFDTEQADADGDGRGDACDNCQAAFNPYQADTDADGFGNVCDNCRNVYQDGSQADADLDGVGNPCDNCPAVFNPDQRDTDGNGAGDACSVDTTAPSVNFVSPRDGARVGLATDVLVRMSEPIDAATANADAFWVESGGIKVPGRIVVTASARLLHYDPEDSLEPDRDYVVRVSGRLRDVAGNAALPFTSTFNTVGASSVALPAGQIGEEIAGRALAGQNAQDHAGFAVAALKDVNADGVGDLVVGAPDADPGGLDAAGKVMLVFGQLALQSNAGAVATLDYGGEQAGQSAGRVVARAGDLNGDGRGDFLIGAPLADDQGTDSGKAWLVFGNDGLDEQAPGTVALGSLASCVQPTRCGVAFVGEAAGDLAGSSLSFAGDVDDDGIDDLLIGAPGASPGGRTSAGKVYLIYGPLAAGTIQLSAVGASVRGLVFRGEAAGDEAGAAVSGWEEAGAEAIYHDLLADDLLIGAPGATTLDAFGGVLADAGVVYAIHGGAGNLDDGASPGVIELGRVVSGATGEVEGFVFLGTLAGARAGHSLTGAVDTDADGESDVYIGTSEEVWFASGIVPKTGSGGTDLAPTGGRTPINVAAGLRQAGLGSAVDDLGAAYYSRGSEGSLGLLAVGPAGDVNGDGVQDVVIGSAEADLPGQTDAGKTYIVYGSEVPRAGEVPLSDIGRTVPGLVVEGAAAGDRLGQSVGGGFDVNADAIDDALVGAPFADLPQDAGKAYVISPVEPLEVTGLRLRKAGALTELEWAKPHRALRYNVYRGLLGTLRAVGQVRTSDVVPPFVCGIATDEDADGRPDTTDGAAPPPSEGFVYLVTGRNLIGEGPLGPPGYPGIHDGQCP